MQRYLSLLTVNMTYEREHSAIQDFFKDKNIFITGGSGYIGKALIEKLLRSCPDIGKIYILIRPKKGKTIYERNEQILSTPLFDLLKTTFPENLKKIVPIKGDSCEIGLGISEADRKLLIAEINIFFNATASVKFDNLIKDAIISNLKSAREAALLALEMKNIEAFLHVSTSYCNIDNRKVVREILYPAPQSWGEAIDITENCNPDILDIATHKYIEGFPNTYIFTKRLAEHCINDLLVGKVRTIISRPSVVTGAIEEPFQGWTDNLNGPIGLLMGGATGVLRIVYGNPEIDTDYIMVDNTVKSMIVSVWHKITFGKVNELSIFHLTKSYSVVYKLNKFFEYGKKLYWVLPFEKKIWVTNSTGTACFLEFYINVILFQLFPALFVDMFLKIAGYPPMLIRVQRKIYIANLALHYFMVNEWYFDNKNQIELFAALPAKDKKVFNFLTFPINEQAVYNYIFDCANYCRVHLFKENKQITEDNKIRTTRLYYLDKAIKLMSFVLVIWLFFVKIKVPQELWNFVSDYWDSL